MKTVNIVLLCICFIFAVSCASTGGGSGNGVTLAQAIEQTAEKIAEKVPEGTRIAVLGIRSSGKNLSDFIMEELSAALFDRDMEVADRKNLSFVYGELDFHQSGEIDDRTILEMGKFLGVEYVITGRLTGSGNTYNFITEGINISTNYLEFRTETSVLNDRNMKNIVIDLSRQQTVGYSAENAVRDNASYTVRYGARENTEPADAVGFIDRGLMFAARGEYDQAIADFTEAIKLNPPNLSDVYLMRGNAYSIGTSRIEDADNVSFSTFTSSLEYNFTPSNETIARWNNALEDYTAAIRLAPDVTKPLFSRSGIHAKLKNYDQAIADMTFVIDIKPTRSAYMNRGVYYYVIGELNRALEDYTAAINLNPGSFANRFAHRNRASVYIMLKEYSKALTDVNTAIRMEPNDAGSYNVRGIIYHNQLKYSKAIKEYNKAISLDPNFINAYHNRGLVLFDRGKYSQAIVDFNFCITLNKNSSDIYINRGRAYLFRDAKGDNERAVADFQAALRLDPENERARINLAKTHMPRENWEEFKDDITGLLSLRDTFRRLSQMWRLYWEIDDY